MHWMDHSMAAHIYIYIYIFIVPGWHDDGGIKWDCEWYGGDVGLDDYYADGDTRCNLWGSCCEFAGHTANTACCA